MSDDEDASESTDDAGIEDTDPESWGGVPDPDRDDAEDREGPMSDLAAEIDRRRAEGSDLAAEELFDEQDVDGVDREALWRQVAGEDAVEAVGSRSADASAAPGGPTVDSSVGGESGGPSVDAPETAVERVIEKRKYCQKCPHFAAPPQVHCTHEGTTIVEAVDMEHFRVLDCPVVAEDEELENV